MNIVPRNEWAGGIRPNGTPSPIPTPAPRLWLHHGAAGSSTVATARGYARFHIRTRGWSDVGYSFLVAEGKVLEGRGAGRQGAHTRNDNRESHGIVLCGDYSRTAPAQRDLDALRWLLSFGHARGWWPSPTFTGGHRDAPGSSTTCPGDRLHRLIPDINAQPGTTSPPEPEDDMARSMLTRIDGSAAVYQFAGQFLIPVTSKAQAAVIVQHAGLEPGKTAAQIDAGNLWQKHVDNVSKGEAAHFTIVENLTSGGLSQAQADSRYVVKGSRHTVRFE